MLHIEAEGQKIGTELERQIEIIYTELREAEQDFDAAMCVDAMVNVSRRLPLLPAAGPGGRVGARRRPGVTGFRHRRRLLPPAGVRAVAAAGGGSEGAPPPAPAAARSPSAGPPGRSGTRVWFPPAGRAPTGPGRAPRRPRSGRRATATPGAAGGAPGAPGARRCLDARAWRSHHSLRPGCARRAPKAVT